MGTTISPLANDLMAGRKRLRELALELGVRAGSGQRDAAGVVTVSVRAG